ncbi:hypothetical protein VPH35_066809 [Triticum aestivum]
MALEEGARVAAVAEARVAWLWRSMAGVRAASWSWSRGEARVVAAAELLCNIVLMNPLPHLASTDSFSYLPIRRSMKIQAAAVADYAVRLHVEPCWALLFFFVGLAYALATSCVKDSACLYFREKI